MIENETLIRLSENRSLGNNDKFAEILASEMNNYYIGKNVYIPENEIIKIIGKSKLDDTIILMPYQLLLLKEIENNKNVVISAPTSFGKSFLVLEFLKRNSIKFNKVVYVVHTKSLKDEIYSKLKKSFSENYYITDDAEELKNFDRYIITLISDGQNTLEYDIDLDLLIVDEAYNLSKVHSKGRYFCIMQTYRKLMINAKKIILLGPFINSVMGEDADNFKLIKTDYSPVTQKIIEGKDLNGINPRNKFLDEIKKGNKTIGYFGSKIKIYDYIEYIIKTYDEEKYNDAFIDWMEDFFPSFWLLPKLMRRGIGLYHSSFPKYINLYNLNKFNNENFNGLISTSALLEGVNTSSKSLVIFDSTAGKEGDEINKLTSFQFFNLCGRVGRLGKEIVGYVYNFGDNYKDRYLERNLPLYIGNDNIIDEFDRLDDDNSCDNEIKFKLVELLNIINIDYDKWYVGNVFYSAGSRNMVNILEKYIEYRVVLKSDISNGNLNKKDSNILNKNKIIKHFYDNYVKYLADFRYIPKSKFSIQKVIPVFLRKDFNGIDFIMKNICNDSEINKDLRQLTIPEQNRYILELMNVGYNYLPHNFYNICYLFNQFVINDLFWTEEERNILEDNIFNRVLLYVNGDTGKYAKLKKILSNMGVIPPTISKIKNYIENKNIDVEEITKSKLVELLINNADNLKFENYEIINLNNIGLNIK